MYFRDYVFERKFTTSDQKAKIACPYEIATEPNLPGVIFIIYTSTLPTNNEVSLEISSGHICDRKSNRNSRN